jgi:hypothetical protein
MKLAELHWLAGSGSRVSKLDDEFSQMKLSPESLR